LEKGKVGRGHGQRLIGTDVNVKKKKIAVRIFQGGVPANGWGEVSVEDRCKTKNSNGTQQSRKQREVRERQFQNAREDKSPVLG